MALPVELATLNPGLIKQLAGNLVKGDIVSIRNDECLMYPQLAHLGENGPCTDESGSRWNCGRCPYLENDLRIIRGVPGLVEVVQSRNIWHRKIPEGRWGFWVNEDSGAAMMARIFQGNTVLAVFPRGAEVSAKALEKSGVNVFELMTMAEAIQSGGVIAPYFLIRPELEGSIGLRSGAVNFVEGKDE